MVILFCFEVTVFVVLVPRFRFDIRFCFGRSVKSLVTFLLVEYLSSRGGAGSVGATSISGVTPAAGLCLLIVLDPGNPFISLLAFELSGVVGSSGAAATNVA